MLVVACVKCRRSQAASSDLLGHCPYCGHDPRNRTEKDEVYGTSGTSVAGEFRPNDVVGDVAVKCGVCKDTGMVRNNKSSEHFLCFTEVPCPECDQGKKTLEAFNKIKENGGHYTPTPPPVATFAVGDVVRLKSSQPNLTMTVGSVGEASGNAKIWCDWLDSTGVPHHALFDDRQLEHMPQLEPKRQWTAYQTWHESVQMATPNKFSVGDKVKWIDACCEVVDTGPGMYFLKWHVWADPECTVRGEDKQAWVSKNIVLPWTESEPTPNDPLAKFSEMNKTVSDNNQKPIFSESEKKWREGDRNLR